MQPTTLSFIKSRKCTSDYMAVSKTLAESDPEDLMFSQSSIIRGARSIWHRIRYRENELKDVTRGGKKVKKRLSPHAAISDLA